MTLYAICDVLQVARTKLCKEFPGKNLHPVGSGGEKLWINLYDDTQLCIYDGRNGLQYELVYGFKAQKAEQLLQDVAKDILPGKTYSKVKPNSLELIVIPNLKHGPMNETQFDAAVETMIKAGRQILESYFKNYGKTDLKSQSK